MEENKTKPSIILIVITLIIWGANSFLAFYNSQGSIIYIFVNTLIIPIFIASLFSISKLYRNPKSITKIIFYTSIIVFISSIVGFILLLAKVMPSMGV